MINRIDQALEVEEFKHMQNMLEPLNIVSHKNGKVILIYRLYVFRIVKEQLILR